MVNVAVVGCGYWGPNLIRNFRALPDVNVKYVCDRDRDRLTHMKELYSDIGITDDFDALTADPEIDAIVIATPVYTHHNLAMKSLRAGKHTFIEKPMASSLAECREMVDLANEKGLSLMVGHVFVYSPPVLKIRELIDSGEIGEVFYISTRRLNLGLFQKDINVAWDLAPHDLSIVLYLLDEKPSSINCQGKAHINPSVEDVTNISLNFDTGKFATIQSSWLDPRKVREVTIVGSKKMIVFDDTEPLEKIKVYDKRVNAPPHYDTFAEFHYSYHYGDIHVPYIQQSEPLRSECQDFIDSIKTGKKTVASGEKGLEVVAILEAASYSLKSGGASVCVDGDQMSVCRTDSKEAVYEKNS
jgi:predicted dehydrogenase